MKPIIGITVAHNTQENRFFVSNDYLFSIIDNGGIPMFLPPCHIDDIKKQLEGIDGLLLTGGGDISPLLLGEEPHPLIGECSSLRDIYELALTKEALRTNKAILGICRGAQVLAVASGGTLFQDITEVSGICHNQKSSRYEKTHSVKITEGSLLNKICGTTQINVNSLHHQGVMEVGKDFIISAKAPDGIIEAIERKSGFALGIQWHSENLCKEDALQQNIFKTFIEKSQG